MEVVIRWSLYVGAAMYVFATPFNGAIARYIIITPRYLLRYRQLHAHVIANLILQLLAQTLCNEEGESFRGTSRLV